MKAVADRLILIPQKAPDNIGGVLLPDSMIEKPMRGKVISAGIDCREVKEGDEVLFIKGNGLLFEDNGVEMLAIAENHVLGIFPSQKLEDICTCLDNQINVACPTHGVVPEKSNKDFKDGDYVLTTEGENRIIINKLPSIKWKDVIADLILATDNYLK